MDQSVASNASPRMVGGAIMRVPHFGRKDQRSVILWKKRNGKVRIFQHSRIMLLMRERMRRGNEADFFFLLADFATPNWILGAGLGVRCFGRLVFTSSSGLGGDFAVFRSELGAVFLAGMDGLLRLFWAIRGSY